MDDNSIMQFELNVLQRRTKGMLFRFFDAVQSGFLLKLPVSRECGLTLAPLKIPIRNIKCGLPNCVFELSTISDILLTMCEDEKSLKCPLCQYQVKLDDYHYDLDLAYYIQKFSDLPQNIQIFIDKKGQFIVKEDEDNKSYISKLTKVKPMNPCTPEQLDLEYMNNCINDISIMLDIAKSSLSLFAKLFGCANIQTNTKFTDDLMDLTDNGIQINHMSKKQTQKLYTFWISPKSQLYLYYPSFDTWYQAELYKSDGTKFNLQERAVSIMAKNGNIYLVGGIVNQKISKNLFEIEVKLKENDQIQKFLVNQNTPMPDDHIFYSYCELDNKIYIIKGLYTDWNLKKDVHCNTFIVYDIPTNKWNYLKTPKYPRAFGTAYATNSSQKIYLFGGIDLDKGGLGKNDNANSNIVRHIEEYNITTNQWIDIGTLTDVTLINENIEIKPMCSMFCINDKNLIIFGGNDLGRNKKSKDAKSSANTINYNLRTKSITNGEALPNQLKFDLLVCFPYNYAMFNKKMYIYFWMNDIHMCLIYDANKNSWQIKEKNQKNQTISIISDYNKSSEVEFNNLRKPKITILDN